MWGGRRTSSVCRAILNEWTRLMSVQLQKTTVWSNAPLPKGSIDMVSPCRTPLLMLILLLSLCRWTVIDLLLQFPSAVRCTHHLTPVLEARSVLLGIAPSRRLSRRRRLRCKVCIKFCALLLQLVYDVGVVCRWVSASESSLFLWLAFVECLL